MKRQLMTGLFAALAFTAVAQSNEWRDPEVNAVNPAHPQIHIGGNGAEMGDDLFSVPAGRNHDLTTVGTHMVINGRDLGRVVLELLTPSVTNVYVERLRYLQYVFVGKREVRRL